MDLEYLICFFIFDGTITDGLTETSTVQVADVYISRGLQCNTTICNTTQPMEEMIETNLPVCGRPHYGLRILLACWPAGIRFAQCIRRYLDSKKTFPHLTNAGKYSTTFVKVPFSITLEII